MSEALSEHIKVVSRIVQDMRTLQTCPDRINLAYRLGKLSDQLELESQRYLNALTIELAWQMIEDRKKKNDPARRSGH